MKLSSIVIVQACLSARIVSASLENDENNVSKKRLLRSNMRTHTMTNDKNNMDKTKDMVGEEYWPEFNVRNTQMMSMSMSMGMYSEEPTASSIPSAVPSGAPSGMPSTSTEPSGLPSVSMIPSAVPSGAPSGLPSVSMIPSAAPSSAPSGFPSISVEPSGSPSISMVPSSVPSSTPSGFPSISLLPSISISNSPTIPLLTDVGSDLGPATMNVCEGDCGSDDECIGANIRCLERNALEAVPGCSGEGTSGFNYCYDADGYLSRIAIDDGGEDPVLMPLADKDSNISITGLFACQGDCDNDDDCNGMLRCIVRDQFFGTEFVPVPGCMSPYENIEGAEGVDYCFDSDGYAMYVYDGNEYFADKDAGSALLAECQADCDFDDDCEGNLVCGQRDPMDPLPGGCLNPYQENLEVWAGVDVCCNPAKDGCVSAE